VDCLSDDHCEDGEICDPNVHACLPASGRGLCEPCTEDAQCGVAGDVCLSFADGNGAVVDRGCGRACGEQNPCPAGYACAAAGDATQCRPSNAEALPTCAGTRAIESACDGFGANCGVDGVQDGTCVIDPGGQDYCSVACDPQAANPQCPEGWNCQWIGIGSICLAP